MINLERIVVLYATEYWIQKVFYSFLMVFWFSLHCCRHPRQSALGDESDSQLRLFPPYSASSISANAAASILPPDFFIAATAALRVHWVHSINAVAVKLTELVTLRRCVGAF